MTDPYTELQRLRDRLAELEAMAGNPPPARATDFNEILRQGRRQIDADAGDAPEPAPVRTDMNQLLRGRSADTPTERAGDSDE